MLMLDLSLDGLGRRGLLDELYLLKEVGRLSPVMRGNVG